MLYDWNPLLELNGLPLFSHVKPEHIKPAVTKAIEDSKKVIIEVCEKYKDCPTWDNVVSPIEEADDTLSRIWSVVSHLNSVCNTKEFREAHDECLPLISEYSNFVGQYKPYYDVLFKIKASDEFLLLTYPQKKSIENSLRDFHLSGIDLNEQDKEKYKEITSKLALLQSNFANNVLDATQEYFLLVTDKERLVGLPQGAINLAKEEAKKREQEGYAFTLDIPSYLPVLTYAQDRDLRHDLYVAYNTRASEKGPLANKYDNKQIMEDILKLRHEEAQLLGFKSYAHLSLATKMAKEPEEVIAFLEDLATKSKKQGLKEIATLKEYAKKHGIDDLKPWDVAYFSEKLRQEKYSYNAEEYRVYFGVEKVVQGLFECAHRVYGISFRARYGVDVWNEDVKCYDVYDSFSSKIGSFYIDLYARQGKRGGAWMDECMSRRYRKDGALQLPVAYLVCNFTRPLKGKKASLTHDEVVTLFHEFGHGLNQLLTRIDIADVSGINGVPWDAVELPSQFNENFAWNREVLSFLSAHENTKEPLPTDKLEALINAKNFQSAMAMLRQLEFALFDFKLHFNYDPKEGGRIFETLDEVKKEVSVVPQFADARFPNSFTHIFAGGYAAGYYSYKWAEVLAADAFSRFKEEGIFNQEVGASFRDNILAQGGACDPMKAFIAFRGRKPQVDALLVQSCISDE